MSTPEERQKRIEEVFKIKPSTWKPSLYTGKIISPKAKALDRKSGDFNKIMTKKEKSSHQQKFHRAWNE